MDGLTKPEPPPSRVCCVSPDIYRLIGKFKVVSRIFKPEFNPRTDGGLSHLRPPPGYLEKYAT